MKILLLALFSLPALSQLTASIPRADIDRDINQIERTVKSEDQKKPLRKFKIWTKGVAEKEFVKSSSRSAGKVSSLITTETLRPFVSAGSFLRGLFSKETAESRIKALAYSFYIDNESDLNKLYKNSSLLRNELQDSSSSSSSSSMMSAYKNLVINQFKEKVLKTLKGILKDVSFNPEVAHNGGLIKFSDASSIEELSELIQAFKIEENPFILLEINAEKLNQETLKRHLTCNGMRSIAPHIELTPFISSLTQAISSGESLGQNDYKNSISKELLNDLEEFIAQFVEFDGEVWQNKAIVSEIGETVVSVVAKFAIPSIALSSAVSGAGAAYLGITALSTVGTSLSVATCTKDTNIEKLKKDKDFRDFCSYVIMRSSQKLLKSKAKGFIAGTNLRYSVKMIKFRGHSIKKCLEKGGSRSTCRDEYKTEKNKYIQSCLDIGYSKKECRQIRKKELLSIVN